MISSVVVLCVTAGETGVLWYWLMNVLPSSHRSTAQV